MHLSYEDAAALDRQLALFQQGDALKPGSRYLFDKLLHNDYVLKPKRLGKADIRILVALAEPAHAIRSIVHLFRQKAESDQYASRHIFGGRFEKAKSARPDGYLGANIGSLNKRAGIKGDNSIHCSVISRNLAAYDEQLQCDVPPRLKNFSSFFL